MRPHPAAEALDKAQEHSLRIGGLLTAMLALWGQLDGVSGESEALRALIDCAKEQLEALDDAVSAALQAANKGEARPEG